MVATWRQVPVSREGQITERFTRAMEHLGSETADVRLGGIYALERIARNPEMDRATITDAGLSVLGGQSQLQEVGLPGSPVTAYGLDQLRQLLPGAQIYQ